MSPNELVDFDVLDSDSPEEGPRRGNRARRPNASRTRARKNKKRRKTPMPMGISHRRNKHWSW